MQRALDRYVEENDGLLPASAHDLAPYFAGPCDQASLARYEIAARGRMRDVPKDNSVLEEKMSLADQDDSEIIRVDDLRVRVKTNEPGTGESQVERRRDRAIFTAIERYQESHAGDWPTETQQLQPYVADPTILEGVTMEDHGFSTCTPSR